MNSHNKRSLAREYAFKFLYHLQFPVFIGLKEELINPSSSDCNVLAEALDNFNLSYNKDNDLDPKSMNFAISIISGVLKSYDTIVDTIRGSLKNHWKIEKLDKVDLTVLLVGTFELLFTKETPPNVVLNEAINISKKYGSKESPSFVNGILDKIAKSG